MWGDGKSETLDKLEKQGGKETKQDELETHEKR